MRPGPGPIWTANPPKSINRYSAFMLRLFQIAYSKPAPAVHPVEVLDADPAVQTGFAMQITADASGAMPVKNGQLLMLTSAFSSPNARPAADCGEYR
jgi:hypothetical protein